MQKSLLNKRYNIATDRYDNHAPVNAAPTDLAIAYYQTAYEPIKAHQFDLPAS